MGNLFNAMATIYIFSAGQALLPDGGGRRLVGIVLYFGDSEVPPMSFLFLIRSFACALMMVGAPADFLTRASIKQLANTEFVRNPETGLYVAEDSGEIVKSVNKDLIINPQKNFEIQQSAPLSAADIQALLSIDPDNLGGSGNIKV